MNWRWGSILILAGIGIGFGIIMAIADPELICGAKRFYIPPLLALALELIYWGWRAVRGFILGLGIFVMAGMGFWIVLFIILLFVTYFAGFIAFPAAIFRAVVNQD